MPNTLIRKGSSYTIPEVPYRAPRPAYTWYETLTGYRSGTAPSSGWARIRIPVKNADGSTGYTEELRWVGITPGTGVAYTYTVRHDEPADPGTPGSPAFRLDTPPQGWTSFAHSQAWIFENGKFTFTARAALTGAAVGFSKVTSPTLGYMHMPFGLLLSAGTVRNLRSGASLGTYATGDTFEFNLDGNAIVFKKNGSSIGTDTGTYGADAPLYMSAALYGAGDAIDTPVLTQLTHGTPAAIVITTSAKMAPMVARSSAVAGGDVHASMAPMRAGGYGSTLPVTITSQGRAQMTPMSAASLLLVGGLVQVRAKMAPMVAVSSAHPQMLVRARMAPMRSLSYIDETPGSENLLETLVLHDFITPTLLDTVELLDSIEFSDFITPTMLRNERIEDVLLLRDAITFTVLETVDIRDAFVLADVLSIPGDQREVHVVNTDGYGTTEYGEYPFDSFACIGGRYYGASPDGLYLLEGDDDAGDPVQAWFCPGTPNFGSEYKKTVVEVFIGCSGEGPLVLKMDVRGSQYAWKADSYSCELKEHRIKLGKGLKSTYLTPVFYNMDGQDFEVDSLSFNVATLSRKL